MHKIYTFRSWEKEEASGKKNLLGAVPDLAEEIQFLKEIPEKNAEKCRLQKLRKYSQKNHLGTIIEYLRFRHFLIRIRNKK